ncbi:MAG: ferrochelatase [Bermanella sp.]|jgi:ferrochelatase
MKKAVILINLGTPDSPDSKGVRRFLREFLADRRVVEMSRWLWYPILYLIILPFRSPKVAKKYQPLWTIGDSPLRVFSLQLADALRLEMTQFDCGVELAMTYGKPSLTEVLDKFQSEGVEQLFFIPLFPQYSATTSAAAMDKVADYFRGQRRLPSWSWVRDYHDQPRYIEALADTVRQHWSESGRSEFLLMSFHGIPQRNVDLGDPYQEQCQRTAKLLAQTLKLEDVEWQMSFQSRPGKAQWLQPYTDKTVQALAERGIKSLDIVAPSFATDCLETLEELDTEAAETFYEAGGEKFSYIPCLNSNKKHVSVLTELVGRHVH